MKKKYKCTSQLSLKEITGGCCPARLIEEHLLTQPRLAAGSLGNEFWAGAAWYPAKSQGFSHLGEGEDRC